MDKFEIKQFDVIKKDNRDHYFFEILDISKEYSDPLMFVFDKEDSKNVYLFNDLNGNWVKIKQDRKFYKEYIDFIENTTNVNCVKRYFNKKSFNKVII